MNKLTSEVLRLYSTGPKTAVLMSGRGSNAETLLGDQRVRDAYDISAIVTDNPNSRAEEIAAKHGLELVSRPQRRFGSPEERQEYFARLGDTLGSMGVQALLYAGFMKVSSPDFCAQFPGVNVHPADLSITGEDGVALYRGMDALGDMRRGEGYVQATVHVIDSPVDTGSALAISEAYYPLSGETDMELHARLQAEEHRIYPATLALLAEGLISPDELPIVIPTGDM